MFHDSALLSLPFMYGLQFKIHILQQAKFSELLVPKCGIFGSILSKFPGFFMSNATGNPVFAII